VCGPAERDIARQIAAESKAVAVHSLSDNALSLGLTKALVRRLDLLVTTDSGPRHFAAAFGVPVVSLFGPTFIDWTETYFEKAINLQERVPCGPCQQRTCHLDHRCMRDLTPEKVLTASEDLLARFPLKPQEVRLAS
jgi:heptosyltransferase-2